MNKLDHLLKNLKPEELSNSYVKQQARSAGDVTVEYVGEVRSISSGSSIDGYGLCIRGQARITKFLLENGRPRQTWTILGNYPVCFIHGKGYIDNLVRRAKDNGIEEINPFNFSLLDTVFDPIERKLKEFYRQAMLL